MQTTMQTAAQTTMRTAAQDVAEQTTRKLSAMRCNSAVLVGPESPGRPESPESAAVSQTTPATTSPVPLERLEARICSLAAQLASSTCEWLRLVAEFDRRKGWAQWGIKSCAHWLSWSCSVSTQAAREYLQVARALEKVPLIRAAFAAGRLSFSKVKAITRVIDMIGEQTLLDQALVHTAAQLERVVRSFRKTDSAGPGQQQRRNARWFWDDDGMLVFTARLPADEGATLVSALRMAEHSLGEPRGGPEIPGGPTARPEDSVAPADWSVPADSDQVGWSTADALIAVAQNALAAGPVDSSGDDRHLVVLHVDADAFSEVPPNVDGRDEQRCHLEDGPGIDPGTADRLSCDAAIVAIVRTSLGPSLIGEPLKLGRKTRKISPALRRALRIRDGGCQHPGCPRRRHLEAHHVKHWKDGGPTNLDNLLLVCRFHHMQLHEGGFTVRFGGSVSGDATTGEWVFHRPDDVRIPATRDLVPGPHHFAAAQGSEENTDTDTDTEWGGGTFSLVESVGVFCRAADCRKVDSRAATGLPSGDDSAMSVDNRRSAFGDALGDFLNNGDFDYDQFETYDELMAFFRESLYPDRVAS